MHNYCFFPAGPITSASEIDFATCDSKYVFSHYQVQRMARKYYIRSINVLHFQNRTLALIGMTQISSSPPQGYQAYLRERERERERERDRERERERERVVLLGMHLSFNKHYILNY